MNFQDITYSDSRVIRIEVKSKSSVLVPCLMRALCVHHAPAGGFRKEIFNKKIHFKLFPKRLFWFI